MGVGAIASVACALAAVAQEGLSESNDPIVNASDWQVFLQARHLKDFLQYRGSTLNPVSEVAVSYRVRDQKWQWQETRKYESLWFSNGQPVGCRRFEKLTLKPGTQGVAVIQESSDGASNTKALADSLVRVFLDLRLEDTFLSRVVVPDDYFDLLSGDMAHVGFYEKHVITEERGICVRLVPSKKGPGKFFFFRVN